MNLLLFTAADRLGDGRIRIADQRLQHIVQVLGASVGDQLRVGELDGLSGTGTLLEINAAQAVLAVALDTAPPPKLPLRLVLALPRPKMLRRILRSVAELGVAELHLIHSFRVEKSYWQTPALRPETLRGYLLQGLEQSRDTVLPALQCHRRFKPFVEDILPGLAAGRRALLAQPGAYPPCPRGLLQEALLVIGPEGGFIPYEVGKLEAAGCQAVSLGPRILRVENALSTLLGRLF
jgi:16S rRNA (uracil1498-N3)-methyltransferase